MKCLAAESGRHLNSSTLSYTLSAHVSTTLLNITRSCHATHTQIDKVARWGDLESDEEESSEEEESEDEEEGAPGREDDEASLADGLASVGGVSSLPSGLETPEVIDLRKAKAGGKTPNHVSVVVSSRSKSQQSASKFCSIASLQQSCETSDITAAVQIQRQRQKATVAVVSLAS